MTEVQVSMLFVGRNCPKCGVPFMITEAHLAEFERVASSREEQHARELASLKELAERGCATSDEIEVFTPPPLEKVKHAPEPQSATEAEPWREERKECPECHKTFGPEARHQEHHWRRKKYCSQACSLAFNQKRAAERAQPSAEPQPQTNDLLVPLAQDAADDTKPEPKESPPLAPVAQLPAPADPQAVRNVPPPAEQRKLPDPRPASDYQPVVVGETLERLDNGNCEECGRPLNAFKKCGYCKQRKGWVEGQGKAKVTLTR